MLHSITLVLLDVQSYILTWHSCYQGNAEITDQDKTNDYIRQNLITNYIFTRPIINSRGRLYIQEADYIFLMALSHWSIQQIFVQTIKVKTSRLGKRQASNYLFMKLTSFRFCRIQIVFHLTVWMQWFERFIQNRMEYYSLIFAVFISVRDLWSLQLSMNRVLVFYSVLL